MPYITSFERLAKEEGRVEGRLEGMVEQTHKFINRTLILRFGSVPMSVKKSIESVKDITALDALHEQAVTADSLADFEIELTRLQNIPNIVKK